MTSVINVTDETFQKEILESDKPVLVDFTASWCGPCKAISPILDEISTERDDIKIVKMDVGGDKETGEETNPETKEAYDIRVFPTLCLFRDGKVADIKIGGSTKYELFHWIDNTLSQDPSLDMDKEQYIEKATAERQAAEKQSNHFFAGLLIGIASWKLTKGASGLTTAIMGVATSEPTLIGLGAATLGFSVVDIHDSIHFGEENKQLVPRLPKTLGKAYKIAEGGTLVGNSIALNSMANETSGTLASAGLHTTSGVSGADGLLQLTKGLFSIFSKKSKPEEKQIPKDDAPSQGTNNQVICKDGVCRLEPASDKSPNEGPEI